MFLKELFSLSGIEYTKSSSASVGLVTDDTREVCEGCVFVCIKGAHFDGHDAAAQMLEKGAVCVVTDHDMGLEDQVIVPDTRQAYGRMVAELHGRPDKKLHLIAVTGTNGKTTTATLVHSILMANGIRCGFIGTTEVLIGDMPCSRDENTPTTPKVGELYSFFGRMVNKGCTHCVMEVSSFALEQCRIGPAVFDVSVFTNLTRDHLDYHGTMENYYKAKKKLFEGHTRKAIINTDDRYGKKLFASNKCEQLSLSASEGDIVYKAGDFANGVTPFDITFEGRQFHAALPMIGEYNVCNAAAAVSVCRLLGVSDEGIKSAVESFAGVRGRCEIIPTGKDFTLLCDYAHSPDGLENMLSCVKKNTQGRLICLFGCGGDRDATKRPIMGATAAKYADVLIVTSDNPRTEDPDSIIDQIIPGIPKKKAYIRITDRREAIYRAVREAKSGDVVVLAGKGHEDYQIIGTKHTHFDEREIAADALAALDETLTDKDIAAFTGGENRSVPFCIEAENISSDTRTITEGSVFIGLKGANFDGGDFIDKAIELGAAAVITDRDADIPEIKVKDTSAALLDIARGYRSRFDIPLIGLTGSVGKTTTKEMTARVMSSVYETLWTHGNRNNEVGMPFTLLRLKKSHQAAVIEMGMSHFGEISRMTRTCLPTVCVITNIGWSHAENLGDRDGILKAKLEILEGAKPDAPLVICGDDDKLAPLKGALDRPVIACGLGEGNDITAKDIADNEEGMTFTAVCGEESAKVSLGCKGRHHVTDALLAIGAGKAAGVPLAAAAAALEGFVPEGLRQHIEDKDGIKLVIDCYNAAPASMRAAIDILAGVKADRHIAVLADMLELGDTSPALHAEVGKYAADLGADVVCYGELAKNIAEGAGKKGMYFDDKAKLIAYLKETLKKGDAVLFKASRGMKMEEVVEAIKGQ